jgi:hypothetical protein
VAKIDLKKLKTKIRKMSSEEKRNNGNPHESNDLERELARGGIETTPDDIPLQDNQKRGVKIYGNVPSTKFIPSTSDTGGIYKLGPPIRPLIIHDSGFSTRPKRNPGISDYIELFKWYSMLETAEALRPDLTDANAAYRHFHEGEGRPRTFSYERYTNNDSSGRLTLRNAILEAQDAAINIWRSNHQPNEFSFSGPAIPCGTFDPRYPNCRKMFPYPATENWQKTIGAHNIWLSGHVSVKTSMKYPDPEFNLHLTLHAEDQYNFNPGALDIGSGLADSANGRFVVVGFAHGYRHTAKLTRNFYWRGFDLGVAGMGITITRRQHQPQNNRRIGNRL